MILPVWVTLIGVAVVFSGLGFAQEVREKPLRVPVLNIVAGVNWLIVGYTAIDVNEIVVYGASDYLKTFTFNPLIIFFGLLGACFLILGAYRVYRIIEDNLDPRDMSWKGDDL